MKKLIILLLGSLLFISCSTSKEMLKITDDVYYTVDKNDKQNESKSVNLYLFDPYYRVVIVNNHVWVEPWYIFNMFPNRYRHNFNHYRYYGYYGTYWLNYSNMIHYDRYYSYNYHNNYWMSYNNRNNRNNITYGKRPINSNNTELNNRKRTDKPRNYTRPKTGNSNIYNDVNRSPYRELLNEDVVTRPRNREINRPNNRTQNINNRNTTNRPRNREINRPNNKIPVTNRPNNRTQNINNRNTTNSLKNSNNGISNSNRINNSSIKGSSSNSGNSNVSSGSGSTRKR